MTYVFRPSHYNVTAVETARVHEPGGAAAKWYDPVGAFAGFLGDIYAWRAINTPGSVWPGGPANYAVTLTDQCNGQVLIEGNLAVPWAANTGWRFVAAAAQWFDTGLIPASGWSMFVQFSGVALSNNGLVGEYDAGRRFDIFPWYAGNIVVYGSGGVVAVGPGLAAGNLGIANQQGYRNAVADGGAIAAWTGLATKNIHIGKVNNLFSSITANIAAVWICKSNAVTVQANRATLVAAMAAL